MHCGIFNNIHGLYPIDASNTTFPVVRIKKYIFPDISRCALGVGGGARLPLLENHYLTELQKIPGLDEPQIHQYRPVGRTELQFVSQWVDSAQLPHHPHP